MQPCCKPQILGHRQFPVEGRHLGEISKAVFGFFRSGYQVDAAYFNGARAWGEVPGQHAHDGRLSRAVWAKKPEYFAMAELQIDILDRYPRTEVAAEAASNNGECGISDHGGDSPGPQLPDIVVIYSRPVSIAALNTRANLEL